MADLHVAVAGATGALGGEILRVLERAPWRPAAVSALASPRSTVSTVAWGEGTVPVDNAEDQDLDVLDALVLAVPGEVGAALGERALDAGVVVVDCSGDPTGELELPLVVPWINPEALPHAAHAGGAAIPSAAALVVASVLGPLRRAGLLGRASVTVMVPASVWGRDGVAELSRQVTALFASGTPPRKVFSQGLAFDLLPVVGGLQEDGWTDRERAVDAQVAQLIGEGADVETTLLVAPVFSGVSVSVRVEADRPLAVDLVTRILEDGGVGVQDATSARTAPRPRRVEGQPFAQVGRLRLGRDGALHLWASMDNLRAAATAAVGACGVLVRQRQATAEA